MLYTLNHFFDQIFVCFVFLIKGILPNLDAGEVFQCYSKYLILVEYSSSVIPLKLYLTFFKLVLIGKLYFKTAVNFIISLPSAFSFCSLFLYKNYISYLDCNIKELYYYTVVQSIFCISQISSAYSTQLSGNDND